MDLLTVFIRRPILASMVILCMVVMGAVSYTQLGVDSMPKVDIPVVTVVTTLPGAGPEEIETELTKQVEDAVAVIGGLDYIQSTSQDGLSTVTIMFQLEKDPDVATQEVRDKVSAIINQFPAGTQSPVIMKYDPQAEPILVLAVRGNRSAKELTELCKQKIKDSLQSVDGVGQVNMLGATYREIEVSLDADSMNKFGISIAQVENALQSQNTEIPGGRVTSDITEYTLRTYGRLKSVEAINDIIVSDRNGTSVKIKDIGTVQDTIKEPRTLSRVNGQPALTLQVVKTSDANIVEVVKLVKEKLKEFDEILPKDIKIEIIKDSSISIEDSVHDIMEHLVIGGGLACIMVFIFMGNLRSTLIAALAIPTSIISTFTIMKAFGYTLNNVTLLALALVVGIVIDDAIVVLENVWRLMEEKGLPAFEAAVEGTREIGPAVIATTISLIVLFIPVAFMSGIVGRYFQSYGITMAFSILISMIVSFVLTPMMCSKLLRPPAEKDKKKKEGKKGSETGKHEQKSVKNGEAKGHAGVEKHEEEVSFLTKLMQDVYELILKASLKGRLVIIALCILTAWWGVKLLGEVGKDFIAKEDESEYNIVIKIPKGIPLPRTSELLKPLEDDLRAMKFVKYVMTSVGTQAPGASDDENSDITQCVIYVRLEDFDKRARYTLSNQLKEALKHKVSSPEEIAVRKELKEDYTQFQAMRDARKLLEKYPMFRTSVQPASSASGASGPDFSFNLTGDDLDVLKSSADKIIAKLKQNQGMKELDTNLDLASPEVQIDIDREKASAINVNISDVSNALRVMVGGDKCTNFKDGKWLYDVRVRLNEKDREDPEKIASLYVPTHDGKLVYLSGIANVRTGVGPSTIYHYNRQRMVTIQASLEDFPLQTAMDDAKAAVKELNLPPDYQVSFGGDSKWMEETAIAFIVAFFIAVVFMYMVLASQFENLLDPVIILGTLPLSVPFALLSLQWAHMSLNMFSALGLFLLFGVVKKNAILQIDHTNNLRKQGYPDREAIIKANRERLRPILMTTVTLVIGMLPVALAGPEGATRAPMAVVVVGGQSLSLLLTLLLVPVALSYVYDIEHFFGHKKKVKAGEMAPEVTAPAAEVKEPEMKVAEVKPVVPAAKLPETTKLEDKRSEPGVIAAKAPDVKQAEPKLPEASTKKMKQNGKDGSGGLHEAEKPRIPTKKVPSPATEPVIQPEKPVAEKKPEVGKEQALQAKSAAEAHEDATRKRHLMDIIHPHKKVEKPDSGSLKTPPEKSVELVEDKHEKKQPVKDFIGNLLHKPKKDEFGEIVKEASTDEVKPAEKASTAPVEKKEDSGIKKPAPQDENKPHLKASGDFFRGHDPKKEKKNGGDTPHAPKHEDPGSSKKDPDKK